jgi:hypothetical protein
MTAIFSPNVYRIVTLLALALVCLCLFATPLFASGAEADGVSTATFLQANLIYDFAANRGRMIQVSLVVVALGCAIMWWYR